jgi:hypothetical protein
VSTAAAALPEPRSLVRSSGSVQPGGFAGARAALERSYWVGQEYWESFTTRTASALLVCGSERHSGEPLRTLYFGSGNHMPYVLGLLYDDYRVDEQYGPLDAWQARRWLVGHGGAADLVVADLPWPYHHLLSQRGFLASPAWVDQKLVLPEQWGAVFECLRNSARGEDLRKIRRHGLTYRIVRDEQAIRRFYSDMYVPHVTKRFGDSAYVEPEWKIQYCAETGALMEILKEGEIVAGQVLFADRDSLQFLWAGTSGGELGAHSKGVFPALFYYGILYAFERGYRSVDYCGSRPFLSDGILQLKRRWGGAVHDGWSRDTLFFRPTRLSPATRGFLTRCPLIARSGRDLVGKVFHGDTAITAAEVQRAGQLYATGGLRAVRLYSLQAPGPDAWAAARTTPGIELVDLSTEPAPEAKYCAT